MSNGQFVQSNEGRMLDATASNKSLIWQAATGSVTFVHNSERATFGSAALEAGVAGGRRWSSLTYAPFRQEVLTVISPLTQSLYAIGAQQELVYDLTDGTGRRQFIDRYTVGGSFTLPSDLPVSGVTTYTMNLGSSSPSSDGGVGFFIKPTPGSTAVTAAVKIDYAASAFRFTIPLEQASAGRSGVKVALTATLIGTVDRATGRVEGTIESSDSAYTGGFVGALFGPRAREIGIVFILQHPSAPSVVGRFSGVAL